MSLKEDLLNMANKLVDAVQTADDANQWLGIVMLHAAELRGISKGLPAWDRGDGDLRPDNPTVEDMKTKARVAALGAKRMANAQEDNTPQPMLCVGGPADNSYAPANPRMPDGAYCQLAGATYQLRQGVLHYVPDPKA